MKATQLDAIRAALDPLDDSGLECDGLSNVIAMLFRMAGLDYRMYDGEVRLVDAAGRVRGWFAPHRSITIDVEGTSMVIDYRARMWLGPDAQHGIFPEVGTNTVYEGRVYEQGPDRYLNNAPRSNVHEAILDILIDHDRWVAALDALIQAKQV